MRRAAALAVFLAASSPAASQPRSCAQDFGTEDVQHCAWGASSDHGHSSLLISLLVRTGVFRASEFDGVRILWCPLGGRTSGTAVNAGLVYLDSSTRSLRAAQAAALLAHEMVHVRQYRRFGSDGFLSAYRHGRVRCRCCMGAGHWMEREAFAVEARVRRALRR
jgi:hypothetical protein